MADWFTENAPAVTPDAAIATTTPRLLKGQTDILGLLDSKADQYGVPRNLVRTVANMESSLNPSASSGKAFGLMQLEPRTAKALGVQNVWDPEQNADGGTRLLRDLVNKYSGDTRLVLAAYNAGEPAVDRAGGVPNYPETQKYVIKGLKSLPANLLTQAAPTPTTPAAATPAETPSPGPAIQPTAVQATSAVNDMLARIQRGENIEITPEMIMQVAFGKEPQAPASAPAPTPAAPSPIQAGDWFSKNAPPPPVPKPAELTPAQKTGWGFVQGLDTPHLLSPALSVLDLIQGKGLGPTVAAIPGQAQAVAQGIANELPGWTPSGGFTPGRALTEWGRTGESAMRLLRGDFSDPVGTLYHLFGSIPLAGAALQHIADKIGQGDPAAAMGLTGAFLVQVLGPDAAMEVAPKIVPAVQNAAEAVKASPIGRATAAAAPDVAKGSAMVAGGAAMSKVPIPEVLKYGTGMPMVARGGKQIWTGLKKGVTEFKTALTERGAEAVPEAAPTAAPPEPAPYTPGGPGSPIITPPPEAAPPPAGGLTLDDYARSIGKEPSKLSDADRARYQNLQTMAASSQAPPTSPRVMPDTEAAQVFPGMGLTPETPGSAGEPPSAPAAPTRTLAEIQSEISQRLQNLQNLAKQPQTPEVIQQTTNELSALGRLKNEQPIPPGTPLAAPPAAPVAPEAPPTAPTVPPAAEAPTGAPVDPVAFVREQLAAGNRVSTGALQRQFGMKYSAARQLLKDLAPPATPEQGITAFEQAKATGQSVVTPTPEPESGLLPGETPAQALARMMPESAIPPSAPEPVVPTAAQSRIEAFAKHFARDPEMTPDAVRAIEGNPEAARLLEQLGESLGIKGKPAPGEIAKIADRMGELRGGTPPAAPAQAAFEQTKATGQATIPTDAIETQAGGGLAVPGTSGEVQAPAAAVPRSAPGEGSVPAGTATTLRIPGESATYPARYTVRELADVQPSHNPHNFQPNERYTLRNDRNYSDAANQERIVLDSQPGRFIPEYLITDSPDAVNGPPVIDPTGNVLGGNSRAMKLARVYANNPQDAAAYRSLLEQRAANYGIDPAQVRNMRQPILVRELTGSAESPQRLVTDLNKSGTASLTAAERATADARRLSANAADYLAQAIEGEGPNATLNDALSGKQGARIINQLVDDGVFTMQEKPALVDAKTGAVTAAAKERVSKMLLGQVFEDSDQLVRTPAELRNKLERIVAPLLQSGQKAGFDLVPKVRQALDLLEYARAHGIENLSDALGQETMFGDAPKFSAETAHLAQFLRDTKPTVLAQSFRRYVANANPTMFGESTPAEAFADAFGRPAPAPPASLGEMMQLKPPRRAGRKPE